MFLVTEACLGIACCPARQRKLTPTPGTLAALTREPGNMARSDCVATIDRWSHHVAASRFCILFYGDLLRDPEGFFDDACRFIGVAPGGNREGLLTPVNQGTKDQISIELSALKAELSFRWLPQLRVLAERYGGACVEWLAAAEERIRAHVDATRFASP